MRSRIGTQSRLAAHILALFLLILLLVYLAPPQAVVNARKSVADATERAAAAMPAPVEATPALVQEAREGLGTVEHTGELRPHELPLRPPAEPAEERPVAEPEAVAAPEAVAEPEDLSSAPEVPAESPPEAVPEPDVTEAVTPLSDAGTETEQAESSAGPADPGAPGEPAGSVEPIAPGEPELSEALSEESAPTAPEAPAEPPVLDPDPEAAAIPSEDPGGMPEDSDAPESLPAPSAPQPDESGSLVVAPSEEGADQRDLIPLPDSEPAAEVALEEIESAEETGGAADGAADGAAETMEGAEGAGAP